MSKYKLSATLTAHEQDVKVVVAPHNDTVISASRDGTVRTWTKQEGGGNWSPSILFTSDSFINALAYDTVHNYVIFGGQDSLLYVKDGVSTGEPDFVLIGHEKNICALDTNGEEIISGSWDSTARVWEDNHLKYTLSDHHAAVWDVKIIGKDQYLTSSADGVVRLWNKDKVVKRFVGHSDVVRGLAILPNGEGFASASNDGTIRITKFNGDLIQILEGHESFVYSVAILSNGNFVSTGEDRTVRIWRNGKCIQVITLPSISVWTVAILPNDDIVTGGSDSVVRIFTKDPSRVADATQIEALEKQVAEITRNTSDIDESQIKGPEILDSAGSKEGDVVMVKTASGIVEAHQWDNGLWVKVGEVVGSASNDKKVDFDGKKWDYVFDVDVRDNEPPLKLPYNANENPYNAAARFLEANDLPSSYTDQVVSFITQNTQAVNISQQSETVNPYADRPNRQTLIPHNQYLSFSNCNEDAILKGITKINLQEKTFSEDGLSKIVQLFKSNDYNSLLNVALTIIDNWEKKLPGFDILRIIIPYLETPPPTLGDILNIGLNKTDGQIYFMTYRVLTNIFSNKKWGEGILTDPTIFDKVIDLVDVEGFDDPKQLIHIDNAVSTFIFNFSVYAVRFKVNSISNRIYEKLQTQGILIAENSSEAAYRLSVAYGNIIYVSKDYKNAGFEKFKETVLKSYSEGRFREIFEAIREI